MISMHLQIQVHKYLSYALHNTSTMFEQYHCRSLYKCQKAFILLPYMLRSICNNHIYLQIFKRHVPTLQIYGVNWKVSSVWTLHENSAELSNSLGEGYRDFFCTQVSPFPNISCQSSNFQCRLIDRCFANRYHHFVKKRWKVSHV